LFNCWVQLFHKTQCVVKDPALYETLGRPATLSQEECEFMIELFRTEPGLFLDKIQENLYNSSRTLLSPEAIHRSLVDQLSVTLKKPMTVNGCKSLMAKYTYIEQMEFLPADFLVFTGPFCLTPLFDLNITDKAFGSSFR
jgi:hypothetical protein